MSTDQPADSPYFAVSFASGTRIDIDDIRQRQQAFMPDGEHGWVISAIFGIDDPESSLDSMTLDDESFVGVTNIRCLLCGVPYRSEIQHYKCPQVVP